MQALTDTIIKKLPAPNQGRTLRFDGHRDAPRGFGVKVTPAGKRAFVLRYKADGRDRLMTIGEYGRNKWSLAAARKRAGELRREIDSGADILEERRERRAEYTVAKVVEQFCDRHMAGLASEQAVRGALTRYVVPALGRKKITDVRRRDVIAVIESVAQKYGRQAALLLGYIKLMFSWCEDREIIEANPVATLRAQKLGRALAPKSRARVLSDDEIRGLWGRETPPEGMHRATLLILQFILLTGQRPGEVCGARLDEIKGKTWTIPPERRGKTSDAHVVPLTDTALEIIKAAGGSEYVFERYKGRPMAVSALSKALERTGAALGNHDPRWRPHDLRRTMRTGLAAAGVSETVAEATIGHVRKGIAAVYDRHRYDNEKRAALEAWERRLQRIVAGEPTNDNVTPLRRGA